MCDQNKMTGDGGSKALRTINLDNASASTTAAFQKLPPAVQGLITHHWQHMEKELAKEELINALECLCRHLHGTPPARVARDLHAPVPDQILALRKLLEQFQPAARLFALDDEVGAQYRLLKNLFEKSWNRLNGRQRRFMQLTARAGHSLVALAEEMNFKNLAAVQAFQKKCFQAMAKIFYALLAKELKRAGLPARR